MFRGCSMKSKAGRARSRSRRSHPRSPSVRPFRPRIAMRESSSQEMPQTRSSPDAEAEACEEAGRDERREIRQRAAALPKPDRRAQRFVPRPAECPLGVLLRKLTASANREIAQRSGSGDRVNRVRRLLHLSDGEHETRLAVPDHVFLTAPDIVRYDRN